MKQKWLEISQRKKTILCAGLDPAPAEMGRGDFGLPVGADRFAWSVHFITAVAPFCAALKVNSQYWKDDSQTLKRLYGIAKRLDLVLIDDCKLADISDSNEAGIYYASKMGVDAVTLAPFAGNIEKSVVFARKYHIGTIACCLMSNPEYAVEKNKLVKFDGAPPFPAETLFMNGHHYHFQYERLALDSQRFGADGIVIGAPSVDNHIIESEIRQARKYAGENMLTLVPGIGSQNGDFSVVVKYFPFSHLIGSASRSLMFPKGSYSSGEDQGYAACHLRDELNKLAGK